MKRHDILAAIAAAAGLTLATTAHAGLPSSLKQSQLVAESMVTLQAQIGQDSDIALSQMIHLAKSNGGNSSKSEKSSGGGKTSKSEKSSGGSKSSKSEKSSKGGKSAKGDKPSKAQGYTKSRNPKASGGPENPGKGNKHNPS